MDLGVRHIRTAGKGSGSVEMTLPAEMRHLVGRPCRIILHDGARPELVLQPDLSPALAAFSEIWRSLITVLGGGQSASNTEPFPDEVFNFGLIPRHGAQGKPYLSWQDGLALAAGAPDAAAAARCIAAFASAYAAEIEITAALATEFGFVCGFLTCGALIIPEWQEACDIAASQLGHCADWQPGLAWRVSADVRSPAFWAALSPSISAAARLFAAWSSSGSPYPALHAAWRRGRSIELNRG